MGAKSHPNKQWVHIVLGTKSSWLHGDPRGFRSHRHRIHSSGDYKNLPAAGEHQDLHKYHEQRASDPVSFDRAIRIEIVRAFVLKMQLLGHRIIAAGVSSMHLHALSELPANYTEVKREVGKCKQRASHVVRDIIPGSIWSAGGKYERIRDLGHFHNTYRYIRMRQEPGTIVWSHHEDEDWIAKPQLGAILMLPDRKHIRVFGVPQTPASEVPRRPGSNPK